jgi:hypothetical protein
VVKIETTTEQITNILARVLRLHQKQCGSFNCPHVWAFLTKIMYGQPNFGYDFANSSDLDKSLNRHKYSMSIDNLGGIFNINHQTSHEQINKNSNCSHENNVQNK